MAHDPGPQREEHPLSPGGIMSFDQLLTQIEQQVRDVDFDWTRLATGATEGAGTGQVLSRIQSYEHRGQYGTNGTRVDPAIGVAADVLVDWADIQTGAAA